MTTESPVIESPEPPARVEVENKSLRHFPDLAFPADILNVLQQYDLHTIFSKAQLPYQAVDRVPPWHRPQSEALYSPELSL